MRGLEALEDPIVHRRHGLPAEALGVCQLRIKQEDGEREPGDFLRVLDPLRDTTNGTRPRPVVKVERFV